MLLFCINVINQTYYFEKTKLKIRLSHMSSTVTHFDLIKMSDGRTHLRKL